MRSRRARRRGANGARSIPGEPPLLRELVEVRAQGQLGCGTQEGGDVRPGGIEQVVMGSEARLERGEQPPLAVEAVLYVFVELRPRVPDIGPVAWAEHFEVELPQSTERVEVRGQRALMRGDEHAPLPQHRVAREADAPGGDQADA